MATTWTPPATPLTVVREHLAFNLDSSVTVTLAYRDGSNNTIYRESFIVFANGTVTNHLGVQVLTAPQSFLDALTTISTQIDGAIASLQAAGKLNPTG